MHGTHRPELRRRRWPTPARRLQAAWSSKATTVLICLLIGAYPSLAQSPAATEPAASFHQEFLDFDKVVSGKVVALAQAIPADQYQWRPSPETRSIGEVFVHLSRAAYGAASAAISMSGGTPPFDAPDWTALESKTEITRTLEQCLALARQVAMQMGATDLSMAPGGPGTQTLRASLTSYLLHLSEHLGQSIAYARSVGTTPPWSR